MIEELKQQAEALGIKVDGRWGESKLLQVIADASDAPITETHDDPPDDNPTEVLPVDTEDPVRIEAMNAYALRIWEGQSPDMPRHERVERVQSGLTRQGWGDILEHLSLPHA
jgi:hypothetical protein